ncbi:MAG: hypothetical protein LBK18_00950 [Prevotellaceae bacterium]|nr:hypothetical protein [Prevotellaceae bacterium]
MNLQTDYGCLLRLTQNKNNRGTLLQIGKDNGIVVTEILKKFSIDMLSNDSCFISLLFYMGLLTIAAPHRLRLRLQIPNYSIKTLYWEYLAKQTMENISGDDD